MLTLTASQAKQNFGALIGQLANGPVAIERHRKTVAIVMSPESAQCLADPRVTARAAQQQREQLRLMQHQQWAIELLSSPPLIQQQQVQAAQKIVARWQSEQLCSADYIRRWQHWLALPVTELATLMCGPADGWGPAMRQNSPFTPIRSSRSTAEFASASSAPVSA